MITMDKLAVVPVKCGISQAKVLQEKAFFTYGEFYVYNAAANVRKIRLEYPEKRDDLPKRIILDVIDKNGPHKEVYSDMKCLGLTDNKGCKEVPEYYIYEWSFIEIQ